MRAAKGWRKPRRHRARTSGPAPPGRATACRTRAWGFLKRKGRRVSPAPLAICEWRGLMNAERLHVVLPHCGERARAVLDRGRLGPFGGVHFIGDAAIRSRDRSDIGKAVQAQHRELLVREAA